MAVKQTRAQQIPVTAEHLGYPYTDTQFFSVTALRRKQPLLECATL